MKVRTIPILSLLDKDICGRVPDSEKLRTNECIAVFGERVVGDPEGHKDLGIVEFNGSFWYADLYSPLVEVPDEDEAA
jgi:hypothetical protein